MAHFSILDLFRKQPVRSLTDGKAYEGVPPLPPSGDNGAGSPLRIGRVVGYSPRDDEDEPEEAVAAATPFALTREATPLPNSRRSPFTWDEAPVEDEDTASPTGQEEEPVSIGTTATKAKLPFRKARPFESAPAPVEALPVRHVPAYGAGEAVLTPLATLPEAPPAAVAVAPGSPFQLAEALPPAPPAAVSKYFVSPFEVVSCEETPVGITSPFAAEPVEAVTPAPIAPPPSLIEPEETPAPAASEPTPPATISLRLLELLRGLSETDLGFAPERVPADFRVDLPAPLVLAQLHTGRVQLPLATVVAQLEGKIQRAFQRSRADASVRVPLREIVANLPEAAQETPVAAVESVFSTPFAMKAEEDGALAIEPFPADGVPPPVPAEEPPPTAREEEPLGPLAQEPFLHIPEEVAPEIPAMAVLSPTPPPLPPLPESAPVPLPVAETEAELAAEPEAVEPPAFVSPFESGFDFPVRPLDEEPIPLESLRDAPEANGHGAIPAKPPALPPGLAARVEASAPATPRVTRGRVFSFDTPPARPPVVAPAAAPAPVVPPPLPNLAAPAPVAEPETAPISAAPSVFSEISEPPLFGAWHTPPPPVVTPFTEEPVAEVPSVLLSEATAGEPEAATTPEAASVTAPPAEIPVAVPDQSPAAVEEGFDFSFAPPPVVPLPVPVAPEVAAVPVLIEVEPEAPEAEPIAEVVEPPPVAIAIVCEAPAPAPLEISPPAPEVVGVEIEVAEATIIAPAVVAEEIAPTVEPEPAPSTDPTPTAEAAPPPADFALPPVLGLVEDLSFGYVNDASQLALRAIFSTDQTLRPEDVVDLTAQFPGLRSCLILTPDAVVPGVVEGEDAVVRQFHERAGGLFTKTISLVRELDPDAREQTFTLRTPNGVVSFFAAGDVCLAALHAEPNFHPGVREKLTLVAQSLGKMLGAA